MATFEKQVEVVLDNNTLNNSPLLVIDEKKGKLILHLNGKRFFETLCERKVIVGAINQKLDELVERHLLDEKALEKGR